MNHFELILFIFPFISTASASTVIHNFPVQKYEGAEDIEWGPWEYCPPGQYAVAFTTRTDHVKGADPDDRTALNAVCLYCAPLFQTFDPHNATRKICSTQGMYGTWLKEPMACGFLIVGFKLNIHINYLQPVFTDLWGALNIEIICSGNGALGKNLMAGYYNKGQQRPGNPQKCLKGQAVCGIRTQVQPFRGKGRFQFDDTMLENIRMKCCEIKPITETCKSKDLWMLLKICNNINGLKDMKCEFAHTIGTTMKNSSSLTKSEMHSIMAEATVSGSIGGAVGLKAEFSASVGGGLTTGYDWGKEDSQSFSKTVGTTITILVPPKSRTFVYQIVGTCGIYSVFSSKLFRGDTKSQNTTVKPYLLPEGFFCDSHSSVTMTPATQP